MEQSLTELKETLQILEIEREKRENECSIFKQEIQNLETEIASQNTCMLELQVNLLNILLSKTFFIVLFQQEQRKSQSDTYINELCEQKNVLNNLR